MLDQRRRRCDDVVQMLYKCFVFAGTLAVVNLSKLGHTRPTPKRLTKPIQTHVKLVGLHYPMLDQCGNIMLGTIISMLYQCLGQRCLPANRRCWPTVCDAGLISNQQSVSVSCWIHSSCLCWPAPMAHTSILLKVI